MSKIGVIGLGVVGYPLYRVLQYYHKDVVSYDKYKSSDDWEDIITTDIVFLCLPTDLKEDGRLDNSIVDSVIDNLIKDNYKGLIVIKSTLGLGYIDHKMSQCDNDIVVFPEWLREKYSLHVTGLV